jgi:hypothetical protein
LSKGKRLRLKQTDVTTDATAYEVSSKYLFYEVSFSLLVHLPTLFVAQTIETTGRLVHKEL